MHCKYWHLWEYWLSLKSLMHIAREHLWMVSCYRRREVLRNELQNPAGTGIKIPPSDLLMEDRNSFDELIVDEINNPVQFLSDMKAFAVRISASSFARSQHKLTRALQRLSSAVPWLYDLCMCLQAAFGGLLVGSSTRKTKWPGLQILQQVTTGHDAEHVQQSVDGGSIIDEKRSRQNEIR